MARDVTDMLGLLGQNLVALHGKCYTQHLLASLRSRLKRNKKRYGHMYTYSSASTLGTFAPCDAAAEVMRVLTLFAAESVLNTSDKC